MVVGPFSDVVRFPHVADFVAVIADLVVDLVEEICDEICLLQ